MRVNPRSRAISSEPATGSSPLCTPNSSKVPASRAATGTGTGTEKAWFESIRISAPSPGAARTARTGRMFAIGSGSEACPSKSRVPCASRRPTQ